MPASLAGNHKYGPGAAPNGVRYALIGVQQRLEQPHRKIAEIKLLVRSRSIDFTQRVVDGELELAVVGLHHDGEAGAKIAVVEERTSLESAALLRLRAVQPKREAQRIGEYRVDLARLQRLELVCRA